MNLVFVYGTLRQGETNHHFLTRARYLGPHVTAAGYRMLQLGTYPGVVTGGSDAIVGEVYQVSRGEMARLDRLEDYPRLYSRRLLPTDWGRAWIYLYRGSRRDRSIIPSGDWKNAHKPPVPFSLHR